MKASSKSNLPPQTALDLLVSSEQNQFLKAALPFFPTEGQRFLSVFLKCQELSKTLTLFSSSPQVQICEAPEEKDFTSILKEIRPYVNDFIGNKIDQLLHMMVMVEMVQLMNEPDE